MEKNKQCFVKDINGYKEIEYSQLRRNGKKVDEYKDRYFIQLNGRIMEVCLSDYNEFYRLKRRQKYIKEEAVLHNSFSYNALDNNEFSGEEIIVDKKSESVEDVVVKNITHRELDIALLSLSKEERQLVQAIFYNGLTERAWSKQSGIPQRTINDRKRRILEKLKKVLENKK